MGRIKFIHSIFFKLLLALLLLSILPLCIVGWVTYSKASESITEKLNIHANYILDQKIKIFDALYKDLERMELGITKGKTFSTLSKNQDFFEHQRLFLELDKLFISLESLFPETEGITIINEQDFIYNYGYSLNQKMKAKDIYETPWFQSIQDFSHPQITSIHTREYSNFDKNNYVYSYIHKAWDHKLQNFSYIIIDLKSDMISNILNENTQSITSTGTFIYGSESFILPPDSSLGLSYQLVKENNSASTITNKDGNKYIIFKQTHPITKWTIVEYFEVSSFYKPIIETKIITFLIIFLITLICFFAALFISLKISGPIKRLQRKILEVENGNLEQKFITNSKDEIGALARGFNHMLFQIKKLIESVAKEEKLKKEAEITALQLQINPHFIYNTLETINSLARKKKEYEISHLIVLLGRLLRLSISSFEEKVTVNQEITYIDYYLKIQKARLKEPLEYHITIDPEIQDCIMIKWILQPIVENAIIHGIDPLHSGGKIYINGTSTNNSILFTIIDNGKGIDPNTLAQIQEKLKYNSATLTKYKKRVGIYNVQTRIAAHHGERYGLSIDSKVDEGTSVTIKIPKLEGDQE